MLCLFGRSWGNARGFMRLERLTAGETRWHASYCNEFGVWSWDVHGFGLRLEIIGPFGGKAEIR